MSTFILRLPAPAAAGVGDAAAPNVAVKDIIDVQGTPTTAGCAVLAQTAEPASEDAACLAGTRAAGARIVGKANLHELAFGGTGINPHFGTPVNPLDPGRIPGGSSSGSAVAVATGEADVAFGTDTCGSVRTPSACCGTVGLKTTHGRIPLAGVWPLAPSLDTVGPMARDVAGVTVGMGLLEPGFTPADQPAGTIGRVRLAGVDPDIDQAVDRLLAVADLDVIDLVLPGWAGAVAAVGTVLFGEAWQSDRTLFERGSDRLGDDLRERLAQARTVRAEALAVARAHRRAWRAELAVAFAGVELLALPTLPTFPTRLDEPPSDTRTINGPINLAGHPALALPAPAGGPVPASLQLVGPDDTESLLLATGRLLESAART